MLSDWRFINHIITILKMFYYILYSDYYIEHLCGLDESGGSPPPGATAAGMYSPERTHAQSL